MPTYEYRCKDCGHQFDAVQSFTDPALTECPTCGGALKKVFGSVGITFKGSGFYKTDSRAGGASGEKVGSGGSSESSSDGATSNGAGDKAGSSDKNGSGGDKAGSGGKTGSSTGGGETKGSSSSDSGKGERKKPSSTPS